MPHPGEMLGDRYRLDDRIAAGGMGEVWQATDTVLGRDVAVKTLHAGRAGDPGFQTRFRHEARALGVLHHPGVGDVYEGGLGGRSWHRPGGPWRPRTRPASCTGTSSPAT